LLGAAFWACGRCNACNNNNNNNDYPDLDADDPDNDTIRKKRDHHVNLKKSYNNHTRTSQRIIDILLKTPPTENVGAEEKYAIIRLLTRRLNTFTRFVNESIEAVKETLPQIAVCSRVVE